MVPRPIYRGKRNAMLLKNIADPIQTLIRHMEHYVGVKVLRVQLVESRYGKPEHLITQLDRAHGNWVMVEPTSKEKCIYLDYWSLCFTSDFHFIR